MARLIYHKPKFAILDEWCQPTHLAHTRPCTGWPIPIALCHSLHLSQLCLSGMAGFSSFFWSTQHVCRQRRNGIQIVQHLQGARHYVRPARPVWLCRRHIVARESDWGAIDCAGYVKEGATKSPSLPWTSHEGMLCVEGTEYPSGT